MLKNTVETERPQMTILHGACDFTCWIIDTHLEYIMFIASPGEHRVCDIVSMLCSHAHCLSVLSRLRAIRKQTDGKIYL